MYRFLKRHIDWILIVVGCVAMGLMFLHPYKCVSNILLYVSGIAGLSYLCYAVYLWFFKRIDFDWHLINGHFLRKVTLLAISMPLTITMFMLIFGTDPSYSKMLIYDNSLYEQSTVQESKTIVTEGDIHVGDSVFTARASSIYTYDIDTTLPDSIRKSQKDPHLFWTVYYHFIDPGNQHMTTTPGGRIQAAFIAILGVFLLNCLLISSIVGWIDSRKEKWLKGEIKYRGFLSRKKHHVIIGGNDMISGIVRQIFDDFSNKPLFARMPYITILTSRDVEELRRELFSTLMTEQEQRHIIILYGNRTSEKDLENLCLQKATEIYILGEQAQTDEFEANHDSTNMQCLNYIKKIRKGRKISDVAKCYVMFDYQTTFAAFQASKQKRNIDGNIVFIPFSVHETWIQKMLVVGKACTKDGDVIQYNNIDKEGIKASSDEFVHMIIVGMSKTGTAMAVETAHVAHFPNYISNPTKRTRITFIDKNAREESEFFIGRFSDLFKLCKWTDVDGVVHNKRFPGDIDSKSYIPPKRNEYSYFKQNFLDIEFEFREGGVETKANRDYLRECVKDKNAIVTVSICLPIPQQSLAAALYLPHDVIEKANDIWVYQPQSSKLLLDITAQDKDVEYWNEIKYKKLKPFGMRDGGFDKDLIDNSLVIYCQKFYEIKGIIEEEIVKKEIEGWTCDVVSQKYDEHQKNLSLSTDKETIWSIWSNIYYLNMLNYKLRSIDEERAKLATQVENNKEMIAKVEHNRWNIEKLLMGYRPLRDRLIEDSDEINNIVGFLSKKGVPEDVEKLIVSGKQNEKDIYRRIRLVKKYYSDGPLKIHPNICPYDKVFLPDCDKNYDICFTLALPFLKEKFDNNQKANE